MQAKTKAIVQLCALVGVTVAVAAAQRFLLAPKEFRGTLRLRVMHIGGEGGEAVLVTTTGAFDLFFQDRAAWRSKLRGLDGKRVVVIGRSRVIHGKYRHYYTAIDVVELRVE